MPKLSLTTRPAALLFLPLWLGLSYTSLAGYWHPVHNLIGLAHGMAMLLLTALVLSTARSCAFVLLRGPLLALGLPVHALALILPGVPDILAPMGVLIAWILLSKEGWFSHHVQVLFWGQVSERDIHAWIGDHHTLLADMATEMKPTKTPSHTKASLRIENEGPFTGPLLHNHTVRLDRVDAAWNHTEPEPSVAMHHAQRRFLQALRAWVGRRAHPDTSLFVDIAPQTSAHATLAAATRKAVRLRPLIPIAKTSPNAVHGPLCLGLALWGVVMAGVGIIDHLENGHTRHDSAYHTAMATPGKPLPRESLSRFHEHAIDGQLRPVPIGTGYFLACIRTPEGIYSYAASYDSRHPSLRPLADRHAQHIFAMNPCAPTR